MLRPVRVLSCAPLLLTSVALADPAIRDEVIVTGERIDSYTVERSNTATKLGLSILETPQSVSVITQAQLDDFGLDDINAALEQATGVTVEQIETDRTYYTSRGFDITNFQVDGVGVPITYGNVEGDLDTALFDRVEIVRGATSLMAGAGNPSATINMVRKRPTETPSASLSLRYGSWDSARAELDVSGPLGSRARGRTVLAKHEEDSYLRDYAKERHVYYGVLEFDVTDRTLLSVGYADQRSHADSPLWGAIPLYYSDGTQAEYDESLSTSADWAYTTTDEQSGFLDLTHRFDSGWTVRATYSRTNVDQDSELFYMYGAVDPITHTGLTGWASAYTLKDERDLADLYVVKELSLGGRTHQLVFGANWSQTDVRDRSLYDYTTGNGFPDIGDIREWTGDTPRPTLVDGAEGSEFEDEQTGFYVATRASLTEDLSLVAGARLLDWDSEGISYGEDQESHVDDELLPYYGIVYSITDWLSVYGSRTKSFMPQSEIDINFARLAPARGSNNELGLKAGLHDDRLIATLAFFEAKHENVAEYLAWVDGFSVYEGLDFESSGVELDVAGEVLPGLQVSVGYTYLQIEDPAGETARPYVPTRLLRASASYVPAAFNRLRVGASASWQSDTAIDDLNYANGRVEQGSYALLNVFAGYRFTDHISARITLNNATDEKYIQSLFWDQAYYGAPRHALVSMNVDF